MTDAEDFERFAESRTPTLARLAYQLTGHRESARDLVQEVLLNACRQWPKVAAASNRAAYVRRMLVHQYLNGVRQNRLIEVSAHELTDSAAASGEALASDAYGDRDAMWRALTNLSDRQRTVLVLRHYEGLDDSTIASVVGCRRSSVRSLAARGLAALRTDPHLQPPVAGPTRRSA